MRFHDRRQAGRLLAERLVALRHEHPVVAALPRGGVLVASEVAAALGAPLDVVVVCKIRHPDDPELTLGAIAEGDVSLIDWALADRAGLGEDEVHRLIALERAELDRRAVRYRGARWRMPVEGRSVIVIDDGLVTGLTARAAIAALRRVSARQVVLAIPVAPEHALGHLDQVADGITCLTSPPGFKAVADGYDDFREVTDSEVAELLTQAADALHQPLT